MRRRNQEQRFLGIAWPDDRCVEEQRFAVAARNSGMHARDDVYSGMLASCDEIVPASAIVGRKMLVGIVRHLLYFSAAFGFGHEPLWRVRRVAPPPDR